MIVCLPLSWRISHWTYNLVAFSTPVRTRAARGMNVRDRGVCWCSHSRCVLCAASKGRVTSAGTWACALCALDSSASRRPRRLRTPQRPTPSSRAPNSGPTARRGGASSPAPPVRSTRVTPSDCLSDPTTCTSSWASSAASWEFASAKLQRVLCFGSTRCARLLCVDCFLPP